MRTTPAGLAEERFEGFSAAAISCSLCRVGTRGCEWAETHGWLESWWQNTLDLPLKTPSKDRTDTHSNCLNSSAAFILESNWGASTISRETWKWPNNGHRERVLTAECSRNGTDVLQRLLLLLHGPGRGATKRGEGQEKSKRQRSTKEGKAGRVCVCREAVP